MSLDSENLIERLSRKYFDRDTTGFNLLDFIGALGSPLDALMYSRLFWPEFVEIDGMIFIKEMMEDENDRIRLARALQHYDGDRTRTEQSFNLFEVPSGIFGKAAGESTEADDRQLATLLCEMWSARLKLTYPDRSFVLKIWDPEETGGEVGVVFFQLPGSIVA